MQRFVINKIVLFIDGFAIQNWTLALTINIIYKHYFSHMNVHFTTDNQRNLNKKT